MTERVLPVVAGRKLEDGRHTFIFRIGAFFKPDNGAHRFFSGTEESQRMVQRKAGNDEQHDTCDQGGIVSHMNGLNDES